MSEKYNKTNTDGEPNDYQVDLLGVLQALFKRKKMIILGIVATTVLALVLSMTMPKVYRSRGFLQFSDPSQERSGLLFSVATQMLESSQQAVYLQLKDLGLLEIFNDLKIEDLQTENFHVMTVQEFKKFASAFRSYQQFQHFATQNQFLTETEIKDVRRSIPNTATFSKLTRETYALSKDDVKNIGQTLIKEKNYVVGADIEMTAGDKKLAQRALTAMGEFIRYSILQEKVSEYTSFQLNEAKVMADQYANYILNIRSMLGLLKNQGEKLQLLSPQSPATLNAKIGEIQTRITDLERMLAIFEMERQKKLLCGDFFFQLKQILNEKPGSTEVLFNQWDMLRKDFFKTKEKDDIVNLLAIHAFDMDANRFHTFYEKTLQFVSPPTLPGSPEWPQKRLFVIFGFFAGLLFFIFLAFGLEFWGKHRDTIQSKKNKIIVDLPETHK